MDFREKELSEDCSESKKSTDIIPDDVRTLLWWCAWRRTFLTGEVPNPPGSGKDIAEGKGVHREVESEGSRMWGTN